MESLVECKIKLEKSILITIGIDRYADQSIQKLSYCVSDGLYLARIFSIFNVAEHYSSLINNEATKKQIIDVLKNLPHNIDNLYLYYSSHGTSSKNKSYLYTYDTKITCIHETGLSLDETIQILRKYKKTNIVLITDACEITINNLEPNIKIFHPNHQETHENTIIGRGEFTNKIIKIFSNKFSYNYSHNFSKRNQKIRQEIAIAHNKKDEVFLTGKSGLGKSYFLRNIKNNEKFTFYISIPKQDGVTLDILLTLIYEEIYRTIDDDQLFSMDDVSPERFIRFFSSLNPHYMLLIDHLDHISDSTIEELKSFLNEISFKKIYASKYFHKKIKFDFIYELLELTSNDINEFLEQKTILLDTYKNGIYECKNYIQLLNFINSDKFIIGKKNNSLRSLKTVSQALCLSGGFIHEELFSNIFKIPKKIINSLYDMGLIIQHDGYSYVHDSLYEKISMKNTKRLKILSCDYWKAEIINYSLSIKSIHNYILLLHSFSPSYCSYDEKLFFTIINNISGHQNTSFLLMLYEYLNRKDISVNLCLHLCEALIRIGKYKEAKILILNNLNPSHLSLSILMAELFWWEGKFIECINFSSSILSSKISDQNKLRILCSRGIGYFFIGDWTNSLKDLSEIIKNNTISDKQSLFFAYCVTATIDGIRGKNIKECTENFIKAISIAKESGKVSWLALVYGNIGEILWKAGFYKTSISVLKIAEHLSYLTGNDPLFFEINRNLLHASIRINDLFNQKIISSRLEEFLNRKQENYVKMQVANSLVTFYIFTKNNKYINYLKIAKRLTKDNLEYEIYTNSNLSISFLITNKIKNAVKKMNYALELCVEGENWLAMKQILDDWDSIISNQNLDSLYSQQVFQKSHQILEKMLLPFLPNFECLCEYLESP